MRPLFFPRLAWQGMTKNRRLCLPWLLSCVGMVFMYYIFEATACSPLLLGMKGGGSVAMVLILGKWVMAFFALLFLSYTHSFLLRRRNREFGLYHVLGMDKGAIVRVVAWETLITAAIALAVGLSLGVAFSKLVELGLVNMLRAQVDYLFRFSPSALLTTVEVFAAIFLLLLLGSVIQLWRRNTLELLQSENVGEKPPQGNILLAGLGLGLLGVAYYMAVTIRSPLAALMLFFVAVLMVIAATFLLFVTGSVTLCRRLQKNRNYYYQKRHFVAVSSMAYRMKRNGEGLASICILSTMVLVMLSSTASLYIGAEDSIRSRYPWDNELRVYLQSVEELETRRADLRASCDKVLEREDAGAAERFACGVVSIAGLAKGSTIQPDASDASNVNYDDLRQLIFLSAQDYEHVTGERVTLQSGESMIYCLHCDYDLPSFSLGGAKLEIVGMLRSVDIAGKGSPFVDDVAPVILFVVNDLREILPMEEICNRNGGSMLTVAWRYCYDLPEGAERGGELLQEQVRAVGELIPEARYNYQTAAEARDDFYATYGVLFFIGILLSVVFLFAATLIIYYKQVSEGYEDHGRFEIMQKVGMTREDIRESIRAQVRIVFFAPLAMAVLHLAFAMPMIWNLLQIFALTNLPLVLAVTAACCLLFTLVYALIYRITAKTYYGIVAA